MINYTYLREKKADVLKEWEKNGVRKNHSLEFSIHDNATILPLQKFENDNLLFGRGGVVDKNGAYIDKSGIQQRIFNSYDFKNSFFVNQKVVYCGYFVHHWGHFLVEGVSRLWYFLKNDSTVDKYIFFDDSGRNSNITGNYKEF